MARQGWNQAPQMMMTPDQIKELVPIIDIEKANVSTDGPRYSRF
jgi:hypothetical protein